MGKRPTSKFELEMGFKFPLEITIEGLHRAWIFEQTHLLFRR